MFFQTVSQIGPSSALWDIPSSRQVHLGGLCLFLLSSGCFRPGLVAGEAPHSPAELVVSQVFQMACGGAGEPLSISC